jgi:hypothetical protein
MPVQQLHVRTSSLLLPPLMLMLLLPLLIQTSATAATTGGDESGGLGGARSAMWPVSISRGSLIAVALRGAEQQPVTFPRPVVTVVELAVPGVRGQEGTANDKFESSLMTVQVRLLLTATFTVSDSSSSSTSVRCECSTQ